RARADGREPGRRMRNEVSLPPDPSHSLGGGMSDGPHRVLITEAVHAGLEPLGRRLAVELRPGLWADRQGPLSEVQARAGLVVRNQTRVDRELVSRAPLLRVVGRLGAGLDNLDLDALRERGVTVLHGGGLNARAV